ncbi:hypothetical protein ACQP3D_29200, partial [Escherichia coli]
MWFEQKMPSPTVLWFCCMFWEGLDADRWASLVEVNPTHTLIFSQSLDFLGHKQASITNYSCSQCLPGTWT